MSQRVQKFVKDSYAITADHLVKFGGFIQSVTSPVIAIIQPKLEPYIQSIDPYFQKSKQFYQAHKEIILIVGVATITYLVIKPPKKEDDKQKKKKSTIAKVQIASKSFISDSEEGGYKEEPSTDTRKSAVSNRREPIAKKKAQTGNFLERIQSSSQEEENEDKIFFEVYKTYQVS